MTTTKFNEEQYDALKKTAVEQAVRYGKTGMGYESMRKAFNDLLDATGANNLFSREDRIGHRKIHAKLLVIDCIMPLTKGQLSKVEQELHRIAEEDAPNRSFRRGFRR